METVNFHCNSINNYNILRQLSRSAGSLSVFHLNVQRVCRTDKFERVRDFLNEVQERPDVISLVETWFLQTETGEVDLLRRRMSLYEIEGYDSVFCSRNERSAGLAVYVRKGVEFEVLEKNNGNVSYIHMSIRGMRQEKPLYATFVYMPNILHYDQLLQLLEDLSLKTLDMKHVLIGDFNIDSNKNPSTFKLYFQQLLSYEYSIKNTKITRPSSGTLIDHVIANFHVDAIYTVDTGLSDHYGIFSHIHFEFDNTDPVQPDTYIYKETNFLAMNDLLIEKLYFNDDLQHMNVHEKTKYLMQQLKTSYDLCTVNVIKRIRKKHNGFKFSNKLRQLCAHKKKLLKKKRLLPNDMNVTLSIKNVEKEIKAQLLREKRKEFENRFKFSKSTKDTWESLNHVLGRKKTSTIINRLMHRDGNLLQNKTEIVNYVNEYFSMIGTTMIQNDSSMQNHITLGPSSLNSMYVRKVTSNEIFLYLNKLKTRKAVGYDGISNYILKQCAYSITFFLTECINECFENGEYPDCLKIARVTPIYKNGMKILPGNYRPISVLPCMNKIFETTINNRLMDFLIQKNYFLKTQFGFRKKSNTRQAVTELTNFIFENLDKRHVRVVSGVFIDFSKAFDTVDHEILLKKLNDAGVRGETHDLFQSYLKNRKQYVRLNDEESSMRNVQMGVPQGSVLGPTLFLVFINDIQHLNLKGKPFFYADDASILYVGQNDDINAETMNDDLELLNEYCNKNKLTMNKSKTKCIHFHGSHVHLSKRVPILLDGELLETVGSIRYLGIILDEHLNFKNHCDEICKKMSSGVAALFKTHHMLPVHVLKLIYFSLIHSHLNYLPNVWGVAANMHVKPLQVLQNRAFKLIHNLPRLTGTVSLFVDYVKDVLPVRGIKELSILKYTKEVLNDETYGNTSFEFRRTLGNRRDPYKLHKPKVLSLHGTKQAKSVGPSVHNHLPLSVRSINDTKKFMLSAKRFLLSQDEVSRLLKM